MNDTTLASGSRRVPIAANDAVSVEVSIGAAIQCVRGRVWLTQEGDSKDYVVPAGTTFCADRAGRAVLTALEGASVVFVREPGAAGACVPGTVAIHSEQQLESAARAMRAAHVSGMLKAAFAWLKGPLSARRA